MRVNPNYTPHRLSAVKNADKIYMLCDGTIMECGTHEELMKNAGRYDEFFNAQAKHYI